MYVIDCFSVPLLALTPDEIKKFFSPVFTQAKLLSDVYEKADKLKKSKIKLPFVTVRETLFYKLYFNDYMHVHVHV